MFLKKIYIHGFKSFAQKTEVIVEQGMTAIVGPNGSGKSNISDAIKWVLGEQSPKTLRGSKMDDIIFAGTEKRMPLGYAEVELVFNNENGKLPVEYKEVSIKRRLFKTGESEYSINKQSCRLKDIKELFMDTGIGRDGYSVIGQGRVEDILSPNSDVRRGVFEEAAGIVKYKTRKEESIRKLEKTNDNLDRVNDIIHELETRVEPLKNQSEKATNYLDLKRNLKSIELNLYVRDYEKNKEQLTLLENQKKDIVSFKEGIKTKRDTLEQNILRYKQELENLDSKIKQLENEKSHNSSEYETKINLINVQKEKILLYSNNVDIIVSEIEDLKSRESKLKNQIKEFEAEKVLLTDRLKEKSADGNSLNQTLQIYKDRMDDSINKVDNKKNQLFEVHKSINKLNSNKSSIESIKRNYLDRIDQFDEDVKSETIDKDKIKTELENYLSDKKKLVTELAKRKEEYSKLLANLQVLENDKKLLTSSLTTSLNDYNKANSKLSILNNMESMYDGYYKSVQTLMSQNAKNGLFKNEIVGTVADIIKTQKIYETAIEIALGSSIQNVIVNDNEDANKIIQYLKDNKIGRVTFLPLNSISDRYLNQNESKILNEQGVINTADKLIETDDRYNIIVRNLLGRIIVVDDIKTGFRISKKYNNSYRIVSVQGDVINPGGSVTGGHISSKGQNFLSRKRDIEDLKVKTVELKETCKQNELQLEKVSHEIEANKNTLEELKSIIDKNSNSKSLLESRILLNQEQINKAEATISKYIKEKEYIVEQIKSYDNEISNICSEIENLQIKISEYENQINELSNVNVTDKIEFEDLSNQMLSLNNDIASINQDIRILDEKISNVSIEIKRNTEIISTKDNNLTNTHEEITKSTEQIKLLTLESLEVKSNLDKLITNYNDNKSKVEELQKVIFDSQTSLNSLNKKLTENLDDEYSINVKLERVTSKIEDISNKMWEDYEMNYAMALSFKDESISYTRLSTDVLKIKKDIKSLGDINLNSIDEYKEVKERFDFLTNQKSDLIDAQNQLNDVIKELEVKMREQFIDEFSKIRVLFNEVFTDLFNGGRADVYLENEDDALNSNIEIAAQPPGKKLSRITLLSGGEKALTAIALLFAILKTKPTPFCILDEIEAALDDINVYRFSRYLKDFSKQTQFLVITHRKGTMENADTLYGTTMEEKGVTKLVSLKLSEIE